MQIPNELQIVKKPKSPRIRILSAAAASLIPDSKIGPSYTWREYVNKETGRRYDTHHGCTIDKPGYAVWKNEEGVDQILTCYGTDETCTNHRHKCEKLAIYSDGPKFLLIRGGEGSGKSVGSSIKALERFWRGMNGIVASPDFEHFKKSMWAEFRRWCPPEMVIAKDRNRLKTSWEPSKQFELHFHNKYGGESTGYFGGMDDPSSWRGPNVNFAAGDEMSRKQDGQVMKVLSGRVRIPGPMGEPPQVWFSTTPAKHWLFDYFGGVRNPLGFHEYPEEEEDYSEDDKFAVFKSKAWLVTILTTDNAFATTDDYAEDRGSTLDDTEKRIYLEARWDEESSSEPFIDDISLWDACKDETIPPLGPHDPVVGAVDGAYSGKGDVFGLVLAGPHPTRDEVVSIRYNKFWAAKGEARDFDLIEDDLKEVCLTYAIQELFYDPRELHQMMGNLKRPSRTKSGRDFPGVKCTEFPQMVQREIADKAWKDRILSRRAAHDGDPSLRLHVKNSNRKTTDEGKKLRIVKRSKSQKIDLNVCASMAAFMADKAKLPVPTQGSYSVSLF